MRQPIFVGIAKYNHQFSYMESPNCLRIFTTNYPKLSILKGIWSDPQAPKMYHGEFDLPNRTHWKERNATIFNNIMKIWMSLIYHMLSMCIWICILWETRWYSIPSTYVVVHFPTRNLPTH